MGLALVCFLNRSPLDHECVVAEVCGNLSNRGTDILIAQAYSVAKGNHQRVILESSWARIVPQDAHGFKNSTDGKWLHVGKKTFL